MLQLLLVVWILFLVILIDNIKLKQLRHFLNLNKLSVYEQYKYVIICSNLHLTSDFKQFLVQYPQVQIQFFKKSKKNSSFTLLLPYLTSSLTIFGFNENDIFFKLGTYVSKNILFIKLNNSIYSINQFNKNSQNYIQFEQTFNSIYLNLVQIFYSFSSLYK